MLLVLPETIVFCVYFLRQKRVQFVVLVMTGGANIDATCIYYTIITRMCEKMFTQRIFLYVNKCLKMAENIQKSGINGKWEKLYAQMR